MKIQPVIFIHYIHVGPLNHPPPPSSPLFCSFIFSYFPTPVPCKGEYMCVASLTLFSQHPEINDSFQSNHEIFKFFVKIQLISLFPVKRKGGGGGNLAKFKHLYFLNTMHVMLFK